MTPARSSESANHATARTGAEAAGELTPVKLLALRGLLLLAIALCWQVLVSTDVLDGWAAVTLCH